MGRTSIIPAKGGAVMLIQKFDGEYAVLQTEDGLISVHRSHLPSAAREGDMVSCNNGGYSIVPLRLTVSATMCGINYISC